MNDYQAECEFNHSNDPAYRRDKNGRLVPADDLSNYEDEIAVIENEEKRRREHRAAR